MAKPNKPCVELSPLEHQSGEFPADVTIQSERRSRFADFGEATLDGDEPTLPGTPITLLLARKGRDSETGAERGPKSGFISAVNPTKRLRQMLRFKLAKARR